MSTSGRPTDVRRATAPLCPHSLRIDAIAAMLNTELADHPVYDGLELQWFDDDTHGTGMLAFLSRWEDRTVDYYVQRGLRLDPASFRIGGGTRSWTETDFDVARLEVAPDGVAARARFTDVDGRAVEVDVDDRDGRPRRRAGLLAPVSSGIEHPTALLLVWMGGFDLVRRTRRPPVIRIDGRDAATGRLPGSRLHGRCLIKYTAPLCAVELDRDADAPAAADGPGDAELTADGSAVRAVAASRGPHDAVVTFDPPFPDLLALPDGRAAQGRWRVAVDGTRLTGGAWRVERRGAAARTVLRADERWRPRRLPLLMAVVTTVVPVFRRWPTTYTWTATVDLTGSGAVHGRWSRTGGHDGGSYRRATGS